MTARRTRTNKVQLPTPEKFLEPFPLEIQGLAHALRGLIKAAVPDLIEAVYPGWKLIGYRAIVRQKRGGKQGSVYFGFVAPLPTQVVLGFEYGILLADPEHLLSGNGSQVRQVVIERPDDIRPQALTPLIEEAVRVASLPRDKRLQLILDRDFIQSATKPATRQSSKHQE